MFEKQVLKPHERFKIIREHIGAKQDDIAGEELNRSQISRIESNKTNITIKKAEFLVKNINKYIKDNTIEFPEVTCKLIMLSEIEQVRNAVELFYDDFLRIKKESSQSNFNDNLSEFIAFRNKYPQYTADENIYRVFEGIAEALFALGKIDESENYFYKANRIACEKLDYLSMLRLAMLKGNIYEKRGEYENTILILEDAVKFLPMISINVYIDIKLKLYYNLALAYKKAKKYNKSLEILKKIKADSNIKYSVLVVTLTVEANCYFELGEYEQAEETYLYIIDSVLEVNDLSNIARAYKNLAEISILRGNIEVGKKYLNTSLGMIPKLDSYNGTITKLYATKTYTLIDNLDGVNKYYKEALQEINDVQDYNRAYELIDDLVDYFIKKKEYSKLEEVLLVTEKYILDKKYKNKLLILKFYKAAYSLLKDNVHRAEYYYNKAEELEKFLK